jgi:hypothetical protein
MRVSASFLRSFHYLCVMTEKDESPKAIKNNRLKKKPYKNGSEPEMINVF